MKLFPVSQCCSFYFLFFETSFTAAGSNGHMELFHTWSHIPFDLLNNTFLRLEFSILAKPRSARAAQVGGDGE